MRHKIGFQDFLQWCLLRLYNTPFLSKGSKKKEASYREMDCYAFHLLDSLVARSFIFYHFTFTCSSTKCHIRSREQAGVVEI